MVLDTTGVVLSQTRGRTRLDRNRHKYDAWLDDERLSLCDLDDRITIVEVNEEPTYNVSSLTRGKYDGSYMDHKGRKSLKITFSIHIKAWNPEEYNEVLDKVMTWAHSGKLRLNYRQGQYIRGMFTSSPKRSPQDWTNEISLEFTSLVFPYWQSFNVDEVEGVAVGAGTTVTIHPEGDAPYCFLEGTFTNIGTGVCNNFMIGTYTPPDGLGEVTASYFHFDKLNHQPEEDFAIEYDEYGFLKLWRYTENISAIKCRSGFSTDDLVLKPGCDNTVYLHGDMAYRFKLRARGAYM